MHLVLYRCKEPLRGVCPGIIVDTGGINIQHLAPEHFFRGTDIPDACQQFVEIVPTADPLEPVIVHGKPLDDELTQSLRSPDAKLGAPMGLYR